MRVYCSCNLLFTIIATIIPMTIHTITVNDINVIGTVREALLPMGHCNMITSNSAGKTSFMENLENFMFHLLHY